MRLPATLAIVAALLTGCSQANKVPSGSPASPSVAAASASASMPPGGWEGTVADGTRDPKKAAAGPLPPNPARDPNDLVAGCSGMNPKRRPRGSNCFGIFPEQCGADIAARHIGEPMTAALAARMEEIAPGGARIIRPMQAVNDDLRYARLNVHLDERDRIKEVDCY